MSLAAAPGVDGYKYTPSSGIWQTVWLEKVPSANYITNITITPTLNSAAPAHHDLFDSVVRFLAALNNSSHHSNALAETVCTQVHAGLGRGTGM